jgi:hypothetical protein
MLSRELPGFILRIKKDGLERQLFSLHALYVVIRRDWMRGARVLFVKKEAFIGSGTVDRVVPKEDLQGQEKQLCINNNWYGKIVFSRLTRFLPAVPVQETPTAGRNPLALHGASIPLSEALQIEKLAHARIIS